MKNPCKLLELVVIYNLLQ